MAYRWLRPALPAGAVLVAVLTALLALAAPVQADPNELSISPAAVELAPGGSTTVQLIADTPAVTLAVWAIDVSFDPDVVSTESTDCDPLDQPPNTTAVGFCLVDDLDDDGRNDTVQDVFALINNDDGSGLTGRLVLADITFEAVGDPGACTDLRLQARIHADSNGNPTNPLLFDGQICIEQDAPPSGTAVPHTPPARTSEPTQPGGGGDATPPVGATSGPIATGGGTPGEGTDPADSGEPGIPAASGVSPSASPDDSGGDDDGDGGSDILFWLLIVFGVLVVAAGGAWALVRNLGRGNGPSAG